MSLATFQPGEVVTRGRVLGTLAAALVLKIVAVTIRNYRSYVPPDFTMGFLEGREAYFWGAYRWAFYTHIVAGPITLLLGLWLVNDRFRTRFPKWHRRIGWAQVALILLLTTPSGLWMAWYAAAGPVAAAGLAGLAFATAATAALGVRAATQRRFIQHRRWMWRCYLLLCSAVVLRVLGGLGTVLGPVGPWYDPLATWLSWLAPLAAFEVRERLREFWASSATRLTPIRPT